MPAFAVVRLAPGLIPCGKPGTPPRKSTKIARRHELTAPAAIPINYRKGLWQPIYQFNPRTSLIMVLKAFVDYNIKNSVCRALLQDCFWRGQISKLLLFVRE
jgi:hypothetical protein